MTKEEYCEQKEKVSRYDKLNLQLDLVEKYIIQLKECPQYIERIYFDPYTHNREDLPLLDNLPTSYRDELSKVLLGKFEQMKEEIQKEIEKI